MRNTCSVRSPRCLLLLLTIVVACVSYRIAPVSAGGSKAESKATYCVAKDGADEKMLLDALKWACGVAKVDCSILFEGQACFEPNTIAAHASYAFSAYYQQYGKFTGTCYFNGTATTTTSNPSHDACDFPYLMTTETKSPASSFRFGCVGAVISLCLTLLVLLLS